MRPTLGDPARHFFMTRSVARVMALSLADEIQILAFQLGHELQTAKASRQLLHIRVVRHTGEQLFNPRDSHEQRAT